jgi:AcrR family transcriptional regulator
MGRKYELKRRAQSQADTRQRIVEAAVALHTTIGPARTTVSAIAERAGVQRHTVYSHFPDERSLGLACSGLFKDQHPLPDPTPWLRIADGDRRLRRGLAELYAYFEANADRLAPILRDADGNRLVRQMLDLRITPDVTRIRDVLADAFAARATAKARLLAVLDLFVSFQAWRLLASSLSREDIIEAAVRAVRCQSFTNTKAPAPG